MGEAVGQGWYGAGAPGAELAALAPSLIPLDAFVMPVLTRILRRFGQNERSLFSFLSSAEPHGLLDHAGSPLARARSFRLHDLYDYVSSNLVGLIERGRRLLETRPELTARLHGTTEIVRLALWHCRTGELMDERCDRVVAKYGDTSLVAAAELAREFRNFLFHGGDEAPGHEDWSWNGAQGGRCRIHRFYSVGRLVLYLIQAMALIAHDDAAGSIEHGSEDDEMTPSEVLERLQFRGPGVWPPRGSGFSLGADQK